MQSLLLLQGEPNSPGSGGGLLMSSPMGPVSDRGGVVTSFDGLLSSVLLSAWLASSSVVSAAEPSVLESAVVPLLLLEHAVKSRMNPRLIRSVVNRSLIVELRRICFNMVSYSTVNASESKAISHFDDCIDSLISVCLSYTVSADDGFSTVMNRQSGWFSWFLRRPRGTMSRRNELFNPRVVLHPLIL